MYSNEDFNWFSQSLLTHKDKFYGTEGYLRISIGTGTGDYKNFNSPTLGISINNQYNKIYNLSYHNVIDLLQTLKLVKQQTNSNNSEIQRKYKKDLTLYIRFFVESNNNDSVVEVRLITSETDFTKIIIPINTFGIFVKCLKYYSENYFNICSQLLLQTIQSKALDVVQQLPGLIKGISSQIVSLDSTNQDAFLDSGAREEKVPEKDQKNAEETKSTIDDLDKFLGNDLSNISLDEIPDKPKTPIVEINSPFTDKLLNNDLSNLESMINNHTLNPNPVCTFAEEVKKQLSPILSENFKSLPDINDDDLKSISYLTKLYYKIAYRSYLEKNAPFPSSMPVFKYPVEFVNPENLEIAYDLLLYSLYIRLVRSRLESKIVDQNKNLSLFHIQLRCITDPFIFSFITNTEQLNSIILNRYKYYNEIGVFNKYTKTLEDNMCSEIQTQEISSMVDEVIEKIINKSMNINKLHTVMISKNKLRLTTKNNFTLEQITKELIPMEVNEKMGIDVLNKDFLEKINKETPISEKIIDLFNHEVKVKSESKIKQKYSNNLERVMCFFLDEIPKQHQDEFIKFIKDNDEKLIDFNDIKFPLDEFGENIVKALYVWNPEEDSQLAKSYKYLQVKIENEIMDKKLILASKQNNETENSTGWDEMFVE